MSNTRFSLICLTLFSFTPSPVAPAQTAGQHGSRVPFHMEKGFLIVVPMMIEGKGPFDFALDTGATETVVDQRLAAELALKTIAHVTMTTIEGEREVPLVYVHHLSLGGVGGQSLAASVILGRRPWPWKVRGILGEDFLKHFEVLLDYKRQQIELGTMTENMSTRFIGEHVEFTTEGSFRGQPTKNRLLVAAHAQEMGVEDFELLLDSGADSFLLYRRVAMNLRGAKPTQSAAATVSGVRGLQAETRRFDLLTMGSASMRTPEVLIATDASAIDADGLLPTRLFQSIFISHAGRFVIFNPVERKAIVAAR